MHSGNYGFIYLLWQVANDFSLNALLEHWESVFGILRLMLLAVVALLVLHSKVSMRTGVAVLLLAHFIRYQHVWEHHHSAVILIGVILLTVPALQDKRLPIVFSLLILVLPTPFVFFDTIKDAAVLNPTLTWPRYAVYLVLLPKVIPTLFLFILMLRHLFASGFYKTREVIQHLFGKRVQPVIEI